MKVFKFGGASVKDAAGVRNLARVVRAHDKDRLIIVVSAMGKTTNALESLLRSWEQGADWQKALFGIRESHLSVLREVAPNEDAVVLHERFDELRRWLEENQPTDHDHDYDQVVGWGEIWSTIIVNAHLNDAGLTVEWLDARQVVRTNDTYRTARMDWEASKGNYTEAVDFDRSSRFITQGFIGSAHNGDSTTLGREGSDFSAAIFAYLGDAESVTIWKDVAGMFNADPHKFEDTILLKNISYREAIELSYFGASVIHPRTVKPLQNKQIPLYVRSFLDLTEEGTLISSSMEHDEQVPSFITSGNRVLVSIISRDLSFIVEEHMAEIFGVFAKHRVKIDLAQNSALAFSVVVPESNKLEALIETLASSYEVRYNKGLELLTVRYYDELTLRKLTAGRDVLVEQRSRNTARFVMGQL